MYKKEDMKFLNMDITVTISKEKIFAIENELTIEEKIKFIDELENGVASYLINILNKWENEKNSLPKNSYGDIKTVSKKAWIKRNDDRRAIDNDYKIGRYYLFGTQFKKMTLVCPDTEYGYQLLYTNSNVEKQWFHDLCIKLYGEEKAYFKSINPVDIKLSQVKEYAEKYHIYFDSKKINDITWNGDENITENELDIYIKAYKKIEDYIDNTTKEVNHKLQEINKNI